MAADHSLRRELSRRIRDNHGVEAGEPGRGLANGDLLRIEAVTSSGLLVRRALDADPATAQHRAFAEKLAERHSQAVHAKDPGPAFPSWTGARQDAILQPPKPQTQPSARILERITQHDLDMEAAE